MDHTPFRSLVRPCLPTREERKILTDVIPILYPAPESFQMISGMNLGRKPKFELANNKESLHLFRKLRILTYGATS
jgi:hypothetical protein